MVRMFKKGGTSTASPVRAVTEGDQEADTGMPKAFDQPTKPTKKRKVYPCQKRKVGKPLLCLGSVFHLMVPFCCAYYLVRLIAAGNSDPTTITLMAIIPTMTILFCCGAGCCRLPFCIALWIGMIVMAVLTCVTLLNDGPSLCVESDFAPNRSVGIIGGGPSGTTAAYMLALKNPHARVDVYHDSARFGGHSDTILVEPGIPIDIGFIFSTPTYKYYNALTDYYGWKRVQSTISVHYHGDPAHDRLPWTNLEGGAGEVFTEAARAASQPGRATKLKEDIQRWDAIVKQDRTFFETVQPLEWFLSWNGYGEDFFHSALTPTLTPLFVTQNGNSAQSAGATLNHFKDGGFLNFNATEMRVSELPPVFHTVGGVQYMYEQMMAETAARTPGFKAILSTEVTAVAPSAAGWAVTSRNLLTDEVSVREYDEVIFGCNAWVAARLISAGGDGDIGSWPQCTDGSSRKACKRWDDGLFRAIRHWVLRNTEYERTKVTLSRSAPDDVNRLGDALYNIHAGGVMTGSIDRIMDLAPPGSGGNYRLRVAPDPEATPPDDVAPDTNPAIAERTWWHHRFNLWEHVLTLFVLKHFNDFDGLHIAGDWTFSVGQDAAIQSGVRAACAVGLSNETKSAMIETLGIDLKYATACYCEGSPPRYSGPR